MPALLVTVRFLEGRYHGRPEWPPSPARLFQALVAGAARGARLEEDDRRALQWLERLDPPIISAPPAREGAGLVNFVPNNDLDAYDGDPMRTSELRVGKMVRPRYFDSDAPLHYFWSFDEIPEARALAAQTGSIAERLYQLGRGVDMAHAQAVVLDDEAAKNFDFAGRAHRPGPSDGALTLACPTEGSLDSLSRRHNAFRNRFRRVASAGRKNADARAFAQPPKPLFRIVGYDSPARLLLFDIRRMDTAKGEPPFAPQPLTRVSKLVAELRDAVADRLRAALPEPQAPLADAVLIGRAAAEADKASRIRVIPLPSIGFVHADRAIRRILVVVPANCPLRADDIEWAFSDLAAQTGDATWALVRASERKMLARYGVDSDKTSTLWRSVTPLALPALGLRRGAQNGSTRATTEAAAAEAVRVALRHEGIAEAALAVRVQREPFDANGAKAENFSDARFERARLWHVEIDFAAPVRGPLLLGDGRWLGLGLMAPERRTDGVLAFSIVEGLCPAADPILVARALRRAVMARVPLLRGEPRLPVFFTGHADDEGPARSGAHEHIACMFDAARRRLLILAPHLLARRVPRADEIGHWRRLEEAMSGFGQLRAGAAGLLHVSRARIDFDTDPLFAPSREWASVTPYRVLRHRRLRDARRALAEDLDNERERNRLPEAEIAVIEAGGSFGGLAGTAMLRFSHVVPGPILIGRDRHFGGGLFVSRSE